MNLRNALRLAWIFSLSASREKRGKGGSPEGLARRPITNLVASPITFTLTAAFTYLVMGRSLEPITLRAVAYQFCVFMPAFTMFMSMVYSLMTEFSKPGNAASIDMVNWLPIQAGDFVVASVVTTIYFVLPMASLLLGFAFGLSLVAGSLGLWALGAAVSVLGCLLGALALEMARGAMNRASGAFSGVGGQWAVILRMLLSVSIIVVISTIFNFSMMVQIVSWFSLGLEAIRFIPILWPSMIVLELASGDLAGSAVYAGLSLLLLSAVYVASVRVRAAYWAPAPVSLKMKPVRISRSRGLLGLLGFDSGQAAIVRKDLRSLVRRREMASILAVPVMVVLMGLLGTPPSVLLDASAPLESKTTFLFQCAMAVVVLELQIALTAFGQEREAFMNLMAAPMDAGRLLRAKAASVLIPVAPALLILVALFGRVASVDPASLIAIIPLGFTTLLAVASMELAVGAKYAVFSSDGQSRFVTLEGTIIGLLLCVATVGGSLSPLGLHYTLGYVGAPIAYVLTLALAMIISGVCLMAAHVELERLYEFDY
jgi:hypothetical protein